MKKYFIVSLVLFLGLGLFLTNCTNDLNPLNPNNAQTGNMGFAMSFDPASEIASGTVTITKGNITLTKPITIVDHQGSVNFDNIQVGHWHILVQLLDSEGYVIYTGEKDAIVQKDQTTTVDITVSENTGNLVVNVNVPGLPILWNKLGSMYELENSEVGPNFDYIQGIKEFAPVKYGNGVEVNYANGNGICVLSPVTLGCMKAGTIEFWYLSNTEEPDREAMYLPLISDPTYNKVRISVGLYHDSGYVGNYGLSFHISDNGNLHRIQTGESGNANITFSTNEPTHLAFVWDWDGIEGTADTMRVYRDGQLLLSGQDTFNSWDDDVTNYIIRAMGDSRSTWNTAPNGKMDNLKIWNYAKTDFSDRFTE